MNAGKKSDLKSTALFDKARRSFVRVSAKEKAQGRSRIALSQQDFIVFAATLNSVFSPNPALKDAMRQARRRVQRRSS
ncbi:MAG: DUF1778 domain-containing protein [Pseudomonadota bacterium]|nr:DUF1778 domain-containing protein [Pseudomonadota bacterium]